VIGWANAAVRNGRLAVTLHFVDGAPKDEAFRRELKDERDRLATFLGL